MTAKKRTRRTRQSLISASVVVAAAIALVAPSASSAAEPQQKREVLRGTTVVTGSRAAAIPVRLPRAATITNPGFRGRDVTVNGDGRFVGFALIEEGFAGLTEDGKIVGSSINKVALFGGRVGGPASTGPFLFSYGKHSPAVGVDAKVPAGDYTLYLLADGSPASVTIKLHGLSGRTSLRPQQKAGFSLETPAPDLGGNGVTQVYSAGEAGKLGRSGGLLFSGVSEHRTVHANTLYQFCTHYGKPQPEGFPFPYGPGCPGTNDAEIFPINGTVVAATPHTVFTYDGSTAAPGWWGQGITTSTIGLHEEFDFLTLWLSFV